MGKPGAPAFAAVLFDMDGVILDSMAQHAALWQELLAREGFQIPLRFILENEGALGAGVLAGFLKEQGRDSKDVSTLIRGLLNRQAELYLSRHADKVRPYPQAREVLQELKRRRMPAALVTSSRRALVDTCLPNDLLALFDAVVTAEDVSQHKPHPEPYLAAAEALGKRPRECLVVENAPAGIKSALAAGATCFALCTTLPAEALTQAHASFPDLAALATHLGLNGAGS